MAGATILAGLLILQGATPAVSVEGNVDQIDVGYAELVAGNATVAIERIEANAALDANEPAALINLGAAHARLGNIERARHYYMAAVASDAPSNLELSDGRWMDSRRVARLGLAGLERGELLAMR